MKNLSDPYRACQFTADRCTLHDSADAPFGKPAHADRPLRLERRQGADKVSVAGAQDRFEFGGGQLLRGAIAPGVFEPDQWAVVQDECLGKKIARRCPSAMRPSPTVGGH